MKFTVTLFSGKLSQIFRQIEVFSKCTNETPYLNGNFEIFGANLRKFKSYELIEEGFD